MMKIQVTDIDSPDFETFTSFVGDCLPALRTDITVEVKSKDRPFVVLISIEDESVTADIVNALITNEFIVTPIE